MKSHFYLNWLLKTDKTLSKPNLIFSESLTQCSGFYLHPSNEEYEEYGIILPPSKSGTIVVSTNFNESNIKATLAHEFRHHWQFFNKSQRYHSNFSLDDFGNDWDENMKCYFSNPHELDALLFEYKMAKGDKIIY